MIWTQDCQISRAHHNAFHFLCVLKLHDLVLHDFVLYVLSGPLGLILLFLNIWPHMMEAAVTWVALISVYVIKPLLTSKHVSLVAQTIKNLPAMQETWVQSLGWEDPLEKDMATHPSTVTWRIPWTEEPGELQSTGSQKSRTRLSSKHFHFQRVIWGEALRSLLLQETQSDNKSPGTS